MSSFSSGTAVINVSSAALKDTCPAPDSESQRYLLRTLHCQRFANLKCTPIQKPAPHTTSYGDTLPYRLPWRWRVRTGSTTSGADSCGKWPWIGKTSTMLGAPTCWWIYSDTATGTAKSLLLCRM